MKRWKRIVLAIIACAAIFAVYIAISVFAGWKHGGGFFLLSGLLALLVFVWRIIVGPKESEIDGIDDAPEKLVDKCLENSSNHGEKETKGAIKDFKVVELHQDGITATMSLPQKVIKQMDILRQQNPEKWKDNEIELVNEAKRMAIESMALEMVKETIAEKQKTITTSNESGLVSQEAEEKNQDAEELDSEPVNRFGNKLESEYRREINTEPHWVRQDDTELCIKIGSDVYAKMIEMQNRAPKKWINKEYDLFLAAKKELGI